MSRLRLYFASDLHGSDRCWKKFLATPKFYGADVIVVGGDITGKFIVPLVRRDDGAYHAKLSGVSRRAETPEEVARLRVLIDDTGSYSCLMSEDEHAGHAACPEQVHKLFHRLVRERLERWLTLAEERLADADARCLVNAGNDDYL